MAKDKNNAKYHAFKQLFEDIYKIGVVRYSDPYYISLKYIDEYKHIYTKLLSNRFKFVFIDEMQDTDAKQCHLLNNLFDQNKTTIQRFGDSNQSIFQNSVTEKVFWDLNDRRLPLPKSHRFSQKIADKLIPLSVQNFKVIGTNITPDIQPHIIIFEDDNIEIVKDEFIKLIKKHNLEAVKNKSNNPFKAIGWVKDHETYHGISSYWPDVVLDSNTSQRIFYKNIYSYVQSLKIPPETKSVDANSIRKVLLNGLVQFSRELDQKNKNGRYFDPRSLLKHVSTTNENLYNELLLKLTSYCKKIVLQQDKVDELRNIVTWLFPKIFDLKKCEIENHDFVIGDNLDERVEKAGLEGGNLYNKDGIELEFSTIHGIKGETHTATLYLETFHDGYDLNRLKKELTVNNYSRPKKDLKIKTRKMAYVAMSRPTHLLCLAMHKNTLGRGKKQIQLSNQFIDKLDNSSWKIVRP
ncbi:MAG: UvrD-helicase domain-containing protein [Balneolaceae bacterium]|nr:UvrD-helicase domain-containing protein [Balneolaceae bacterium]